MSIVGYTFQADLYCPHCIIGVMGHARPPELCTEDALDILASDRGVNREDEVSFDSGAFPKVMLRAHQDCTDEEGCLDHCGNCGVDLGGDCHLEQRATA